MNRPLPFVIPPTLRGDIYGGITSAIVALPLAIAFGVSSGAGPLAGLYGAIFLGFFSAIFGGTRQQVSGPTGPMTVVMAAVIAQFGDLYAAFTTVMLAGFIQILMGKLGIGRFIRLVPQPVISGFMTGIGVIIIIVELGPLLGQHESSSGTVLQKLLDLPLAVSDLKPEALILGLLTLAIMFLTPKRVTYVLPAPLIALTCCSVLAYFVFPNASLIGPVPSGLPTFTTPSIDLALLPEIMRYAIMLALLGAIDSLLTSLVVDSKTQTNHDSNKELVGQGIGNMLAGFFGGLPGAGATMRSLINIRSGGQTRFSGALHALLLLAIVLGFGSSVSHIPLAVLAGILIKVGIDIIDWPYLRTLHQAPRAGVIIMFTTLLITVFVDLITAVAVGFIMASVLFVSRMADAQLKSLRFIHSPDAAEHWSAEEREILSRNKGHILLLELEGPLSFGSARDIAELMKSSHSRDVLAIDFRYIPFIDSSASTALKEVISHLHNSQDHLLIFNAQENVMHILQKMGVIKQLGADRIVANRLDALRLAEYLLSADSPRTKSD